jgi:hypothetical protein
MGETVDPGIGGDARRDGKGQLIIDDGGERHGAEAGDQHFLVRRRVGDDGEARRLGARAGGGGDGDDGQARGVRHVRDLVVAHGAAAMVQDRHGLGGVDR